MKISRRMADGIIGGSVGLFGPAIGGLTYRLFFGDRVNTLTMIPFFVFTMITTIIILIVLMRVFSKKIKH